MKYKVVAIEKRKTREDKEFYSLTLGDEATNTEIEKVSAFDNLDKFAVGGEVEGSIVENSAGYKNFRFPREAGVKGQGGSKTAQMEKVMDRKEQSILGAMDRKERGILLSSAQRDASLMVTTLIGSFPEEYKDWNSEMIKTEIRAWRSFYLNLVDEQPNEPFN